MSLKQCSFVRLLILLDVIDNMGALDYESIHKGYHNRQSTCINASLPLFDHCSESNK